MESIWSESHRTTIIEMLRMPTENYSALLNGILLLIEKSIVIHNIRKIRVFSLDQPGERGVSKAVRCSLCCYLTLPSSLLATITVVCSRAL